MCADPDGGIRVNDMFGQIRMQDAINQLIEDRCSPEWIWRGSGGFLRG
jgi:hypothetical protein